MSTAYARRIKAQGSERFLKIGGRVFTFHPKIGGGRELSEVLDAKEGTILTFPGYVRGQKHYGFPMLNSAALCRKFAMNARRSFERRHWISKAFEELRSASEVFPKPPLDPVEQEMRRAA